MSALELAQPAIVLEYRELQDRPVPDWLSFAMRETIVWLSVGYQNSSKTGGTVNTSKAYAGDLGVPRGLQAWRPPPGKVGRRSPGVRPQAFLRWSAAFDVNPFTDLDVDLAHNWIRYARGCGDSDATLHRRVGALNAWYSAMRRRRHTGIVLADLINAQDRRNLHITIDPNTPSTNGVPLEVVQALRVAALVDPSPLRSRNRLIVELLPGLGLRAAELCGLDLDDVLRYGPDGKPALRVHGKGAKDRLLALDDYQVALIDDYLLDRVAPPTGTDLTLPGVTGNRPAVAQPLLTSVNGLRLSTQAVSYTLNRLAGLLDPGSDHPVIAEAARMLERFGHLHPHQLRHAHVHFAEDAGASANDIRIQVGHASLATTQLYLDTRAKQRASTSVAVSRLVRGDVDLNSLPTDGIRLRNLPDLPDLDTDDPTTADDPLPEVQA